MHLRPPFTLTNCAAAGDGGSLAVQVTDCDDRDHWVTLVQHRFLEGYSEKRIPGRLYWNDELIGIRSAEESALLASLVSPAVDGSMDTDLRAARNGAQEDTRERNNEVDDITVYASEYAEKIQAFVLSDRYMEIAEQLREE